MTSILHAVKALHTPQLIAAAAQKHGETEVAITKAVNCIAPALLVALLAKCGDSHSIDQLFKILQQYDTSSSKSLENMLTDGPDVEKGAIDEANVFVQHLFGAKVPAIANAVAAFSTVKPSTASALLGFTSALVMRVLNQKMEAEKLSSTTLVSSLLQQKTAWMGLLPANVAAMLGLQYAGLSESRIEGLKWLWPLLLLLILGAVVIYFLKNGTGFGQ